VRDDVGGPVLSAGVILRSARAGEVMGVLTRASRTVVSCTTGSSHLNGMFIRKGKVPTISLLMIDMGCSQR
jgi:hypothetical protein